MANATPISPTIAQAPTREGKFTTYMKEIDEWQSRSATMASAFAWIPTVFAVSQDGKDVSIDGYINGIGSREQYPVLYKLLEEVFKIVVPMLERTVKVDSPSERNDTSSKW
jgi:hypothetical protein